MNTFGPVPDHTAQCVGCRWNLREGDSGVTGYCYMFRDPPTAPCAKWRPAAERLNAMPSLIPELPDSFAIAMAKVEQLREANNERLARRDRAEWECFFHFACENALFKRQAE